MSPAWSAPRCLGHFGDKVGRKSMLLVSLIMMGSATFAIGLLARLPLDRHLGAHPAADAARHPGPCARRRMGRRGIDVRWNMRSPHRRGLYGSWVQIGVPAGTLIANPAFLLSNAVMSNEALLSWGWRIPFLASVLAGRRGHVHSPEHIGNAVVQQGQGSVPRR
ncbi:hypothetical protein ACU4GD_00180 [Cupriavidus basilensis]